MNVSEQILQDWELRSTHWMQALEALESPTMERVEYAYRLFDIGMRPWALLHFNYDPDSGFDNGVTKNDLLDRYVLQTLVGRAIIGGLESTMKTKVFSIEKKDGAIIAIENQIARGGDYNLLHKITKGCALLATFSHVNYLAQLTTTIRERYPYLL